MDEAGDFVIVWEDGRNGDWDIYCQRYDPSGNSREGNFRVNDDVGGSDQWYPSVTMDPGDGRFVVLWTDFRHPDGDPELVAQRYEDGTPVGRNVQIHEPDLFSYNHQQSARSSIACNSDVVCFAWMDNRRHKGWDIYGKLTEWELVGIEETEDLVQRWDYGLTVHPNPCMSEILMRYELTHSSKVHMVIYNPLGRQVRTLVDTNQKAGLYTFIWDGTDNSGRRVSSGSYFLRLEAGDYTATRKLCVVR
jgi:hypothetical protein